MAVYIGYALSTSVVGFSGWRYILPVDWIILFYWAAGLFEAGRLLRSVFRVKTEPDAVTLLKTPTREWRIGILLAVGLLVGLLIPIGESLFPKKMGELGQDDIMNKIKASPATAEILTLAEQPDSQVVQGMLYYPMVLLDEDDFARLKIRSSWIISERPVLKFVVAHKNKTQCNLADCGNSAKHFQ